MARNTFEVDEKLEKEAEFKLANLVRLKKYIKPYSKDLLNGFLVTVMTSLIGLSTPYLLKMTIDDFIPNKNIMGIVIISTVLLIGYIISIYLMKYKILAMSRVGQGIIRDLRLDLFSHMQRLPFSYYDSRPHGKIIVRVVNYVNSISDLMSNGVVNVVTEILSLVIILVIMFFLNARLTLIALAALPLLFAAVMIIKTLQRTAWRINSMKNSNMVAYMHESLRGVRITQSFSREEFNIGIMSRLIKNVQKSWLKAVRIMYYMWPSIDIISTISVSTLYIFGVYVLSGEDVANPISLGVLIAFIGYVHRFWGPIANISNFYNSIVINMTYLERIYESIDEPLIVDDKPNAEVMPPIKGKVEFDDITFSYDEGRPILRNVSFVANAGDTIALVGPTGAGKTTVVNLISRFYNVDSGQVRIDDVDISGVQLNSLRKQMGIMLQDSFIFSGTVMDNIRYGKLDATEEEIIAAAKAVKAHDFIIELEDGYNTEVNEQGSRLSAGQRQLVSFARSLLADPKILILDEATSSIDTKTELILQEGLNQLLKGRTSFIIAHRLSTIKNANKIMYVDKGQIIESGNHDELMEQKGAYYQLNVSQYAFLLS